MYQNDGSSAVIEPPSKSLFGSHEYEELGVKHHYKFGQKSAALLGLSLSSDGSLYAFANHRPPSRHSNDEPNAMNELYRSSKIMLRTTGEVHFKLSLMAPREGLLTLEPLVWPKAYEVNRTHFLGMFNPFGTDEIDYPRHGGTKRSRDIPANRAFAGIFRYNPNAADPRKKAILTLLDLETNGQSEENVFISAFDDESNGDPGGVMLAIRVNAANYSDACASLEFTDGNRVDVTNANGVVSRNLARLALNTSDSPL